MRFRKSVRIAKGVKLNLSKTGASFTLGGGKGLSFNVGNRGAFLNWSIPGTGVYDRVRLDTLLKDKLGGLFGFGKPAQETDAPKRSGKAAKAPARPDDAQMEEIAQEIALINIHQQAIDVASAQPGTLDEAQAEAAIADWLSEGEAPIGFAVDCEAIAGKAAVMIDLDLPEIEDMPRRKLVQMADGSVKIKKKSQKELREDYRTCVLGLGEYVASHALALVPQAQKVVVSAYTQRRSEKTGEAMDVFIYSIVFAREAFAADYQQRDPYDFCQDLPGRFYVLASGVMKEIAPFEAADIE